MKILYLVHQFFPMHYTGTEKFLLNLTSTMQRWGNKVKVVAYSFYDDTLYENDANGMLSREFLYKGIPVHAYKQKQPPEDVHYGIGNAPLVQYAEGLLRREKPDIVHVAHSMRVGEFARAAKRLGIPYVVTLTDFFFICPKCILITSGSALCNGPEGGIACARSCPEFHGDFIRARLEVAQDILANARCVIAPSRFLGSLFKNELPFLEPKVIPYGIDFSTVRRNVRHYQVGKPFVVLYAGQINYHKGVHVLLDAFTRIKAKNATLKLYGSGPDGATRNFKEMVKADPRVEFCGVYKEHEIGEIFSAADVVVIPSNWHENNTIVMREALASHVPCIVSNAGGMIEKIQDGVNGFVFRMGDADHLKEILERIIEQPSLLHDLRQNLHTYALTTVEQEAFDYHRIYQSMV